MNPEMARLRQQQQEKIEVEQRSESENEVQELASPEELIRRDARQTEPPASIAHRLNESIKQEPKPVKSWWKRFVTGS